MILKILYSLNRDYVGKILAVLLIGFTPLLGEMASGDLIPIQTVSTGSSPLGIAFAPTSTFITSTTTPMVCFADTANQNSVYIYSVEESSDTVDSASSQLQTGAIANCIAYSQPSYDYGPPVLLFAGVTYNGNGSADASGFSIYSVNFPTGALSLLASYSFPGGAQTIAFSPLLYSDVSNTYQQFVAVASPTTLKLYSIDPSSGVLTSLQSFSLAGSYENPSVAFGYSPLSSFLTLALSLASTDGSSSVINFYRFSYSSLTMDYTAPSGGIGFTTPAQSPGALAFPSQWSSFNQLFLALTDNAASDGTNGLYIYQVAPSGVNVTATLTAVANTGASPLGVDFSDSQANSKAVYITVANSGADTLSVFSMSTSGGLTALSTVNAGSAPAYVAYSPYFKATVNGKSTSFMYLAATNNGSSNISFYKVNLMGSPTNVSGTQSAQVNGAEVAVTGGSRAKRSSKIEYVNTLTWDPPLEGSESIAYYEVVIVKNGEKKVLAQIPTDSPRQFSHGGRKPCSKDRYKIYAVSAERERSPPAKVTVVGKKTVFFKVRPCPGRQFQRCC